MSPETVPGVSALTLGAVQLGMTYGIANTTGQPDYREARDIIATAWESGITCIDTAAAYGDSEVVIGRALRELGLRDRVTVVTKVAAFNGSDPLEGADDARRRIRQSVTGSLARLGVERLDICLFHSEEDLCFVPDLLADERIALAGCSIMSLERFRDAVAAPGLRAVQIPANVVDTRCTREGDAARAAALNLFVFARSAYLQGLLVMPEAHIPRHLTGIIPVRRRLEQVAAAAGMSLSELALRYVLSLPGIGSVVVGAESTEQIRRSAACAARGPLPAEVMAAAGSAAALAPLPEALITPSLWPRLAEAGPKMA